MITFAAQTMYMKKIACLFLMAVLGLTAHAQLADIKAQVSHMAKGNRAIGTTVTDFAMDDADGKSHRLSEWCGKGNYVLIDFWASWCAPCLRELPNVVKCYDQYHGKGFEVLGISFDNQKDAWLAAVKRLNMAWPQLSDLKGWKSLAAQMYDVRAIPFTLLFDPEGKVVDANLRGEALTKKLEELIGK